MTCLVKKHDLELKRQLVANHCVATLKDSSLVDLCLFAGEGKPVLLGGFVLSPRQAFDLGKALTQTSAYIERATEDERRRIVQENIVLAYTMLKDIDTGQAEKLKELFDIKIVQAEEPKSDQGYIG